MFHTLSQPLDSEDDSDSNAFSQDFGYATEGISAAGRTSSSAHHEKRPQTQQGQRQRQGQEVGPNESHPFQYSFPSSIPDWLLTVPLLHTVDYIILNTPVDIV